MAFRFFRRMRIAPGLTLNLSKRGASVSMGPRGAKYTVGTSGRRVTAGIPGTGLFYTQQAGGKSSTKMSRKSAATVRQTRTCAKQKLDLSFFQRLTTSSAEKSFLDGCRDVIQGHPNKAYDDFKQAVDLSDGAFMAGIWALKNKDYADARFYLESALSRTSELGTLFRKYQLDLSIDLPITPAVSALITSSTRGALLALTEVYQALKQYAQAADCLKRLRRYEPADPVVKLSLAELLYDLNSTDKKTLKYILKLSENIDNTSAVEAALLLYRGRALSGLGLDTAARDTLTQAFRRKKGRSEELLLAIQYDRALAYQNLGQRQRCRQELEKIYALKPTYEDVEKRLLG